MSPAVTSATPGSRGDSTSASDPNSFYASSASSLQISYANGDGHVTTQELQSFNSAQFSAEVEDIFHYPMASTDLFQHHDRLGNQTSLNGTNVSNPGSQRHFANTTERIGAEMDSPIGVSLKFLTLMPDPYKENSAGYTSQGVSKPESMQYTSLDKSSEPSQYRQDSGIFEDTYSRSALSEDSSDGLDVHCSGSVTSDLDTELQEALSSDSSDVDRGTDSATSDLEKELIPITQKLERVIRHPQDNHDFEYSQSDDFERSTAPEAEVIAAAASIELEGEDQEAIDKDFYNSSAPPTPMASESDIEGFGSPPASPIRSSSVDQEDAFANPPDTPTYEAVISDEVHQNQEAGDTPDDQVQGKAPALDVDEILESNEVHRQNSTPVEALLNETVQTKLSSLAEAPLEESAQRENPIVELTLQESAPLENIAFLIPTPVQKVQSENLATHAPKPETQCNDTIPTTTIPTLTYEDIPPVLTPIYEDIAPFRNTGLYSLANDGASTSNSYLRPSRAETESPPILTREAPWQPAPAPSPREKPTPKSRRGTRKFITPRNCPIIPHSSAEIQERVKNRQRNSVVAYCSSPAPSPPVISEPGILRTDYFGQPEDSEYLYSKEHKHSKVLAGTSDIKNLKPKPKRGRKRKGSDERQGAIVSKKPKSDKGLFIVEKILRKTVVDGVPYFLVKWLNYPDTKNTWEPYENFSAELIAAFENSLRDAKLKPKEPEVPVVPAQKGLTPPLIRRRSTAVRNKCAGCASYPTTFTDQRNGLTGFDLGYTYSNTRESFILDGVKCGLVEFDEKRVLELIPFSVINAKIRAQLVNI